MFFQFLLYSHVTKSYTYTHTHILFCNTVFHHVLTQVTVHSFLCCTVGSHCLSIPNITVCISKPPTARPPYSLLSPPRNHKSTLLGHDVFLFGGQEHLCHILDSANKRQHMVFVFFFLAHFTQYENLQFYPCCCRCHQFIFFMSCTHFCVNIQSSLKSVPRSRIAESYAKCMVNHRMLPHCPPEAVAFISSSAV